MLKHSLRHVTKGVTVGFIDHDVCEVVLRPLVQPSSHALRRSDDNAIAHDRLAIRHFNGWREKSILRELVGILVNKLLSVRKKEHWAVSNDALRKPCCYQSFATARRGYAKDAVVFRP